MALFIPHTTTIIPVEGRYDRGSVLRVDMGGGFPRTRFTFLQNQLPLTPLQVRKLFTIVQDAEGAQPRESLRAIGYWLMTNVIEYFVFENNIGAPEWEAITRIEIGFVEPEIREHITSEMMSADLAPPIVTARNETKLRLFAYALLDQMQYDEEPAFEQHTQQQQ